MYDDEYATCEATHATLAIYNLPPGEVTSALGLQATTEYRRGVDPANHPSRIDAWLLESAGSVSSRDARRHIDWLLDQLMPRKNALLALVERGARVTIHCYWLSASGHGGPTISPSQSSKLAELGLDIGFDLYSASQSDD